MKNIAFIPVIFYLGCLFSSCLLHSPCTFDGLCFFVKNDSIDTVAVISKYKPGTNFTTQEGMSTAKVNWDGSSGSIFYWFGTDTDFVITLSPTGKVYKVKNISHGNEPEAFTGGKEHYTQCSYSCAVNDSTIASSATTIDANTVRCTYVYIQ